MNTDTRRVIIGFINLNEEERAEFFEQIVSYYKKNPDEQQIYEALQEAFIKLAVLNKSSAKSVLGPTPGPCPCCHK